MDSAVSTWPEDEKELTRWQKLGRWWLSKAGIAVMVVFVLAGLVAWKSVQLYHLAKDWRAQHLVDLALEAGERGEDAEALRLLREAAALVQRTPTTLRAVAQYSAAHHSPAAVKYYEELGASGEATVEDWIAMTREAFRFGMLAKARRGLDELEKSSSAALLPEVIALKVEWLARDGRWPEAEALGRRIVSKLPPEEGAEERLVFARVLLQPPSFRQHDRAALLREGFGILATLAARPDDCGWRSLQLLQRLAQDAGGAELLKGANVQPWMDAAARNPGGDALTRVKCWDLRLAAQPDQRDAIVRELAERAGAVSAADQLEIARWLLQHGANALAGKLAKPSKLKSEEWFMVYLDAVAGVGDWEAVLAAVTTSETLPLPASVRRLFQLRAELELGREPNAGFAWNAINIGLGAATARQALYVAGYAEQMKFSDQAGPIYQRLLKQQAFLAGPGEPENPQRLACYLGVMRTASTSMTTRDLAKFLRDFATEFPALDEVQNDAAYLQLLLDQESEPSQSAAERLLRLRPELLAYRTTAALAALRQGKIAEAHALYGEARIQWGAAPDRYKAVRVAVLAANQLTSAAEEMRAMIRPETLRPEERELAGLR